MSCNGGNNPSKPEEKLTSFTKKNWDKLVKDFEEEEKKDEGGSSVDTLFRQIYESADEKTRRAMNKSFVESAGTCLSTNWEDVSKKKVEITPPDGVEYRKWD